MKKSDELRKQLAPWFRERNFVSNSTKRIWFKDHGYYIIVAEIRPYYDMGFFLDIGVKFMWSSYYDVSYDYSNGDTRVYGQADPNPTMGAIFWESPSYEREVSFMLHNADFHICEYDRLETPSVLLDRLINRNDFVKRGNPKFSEKDVSLGIVQRFLGEDTSARNIFQNASQTNPVAQSLLECCSDSQLFLKTVCDIVNECRTNFAQKKRIQLDAITKIFDNL